jgi:hypothetical protein
MDCGKARELLSAYHDGELAPADRARVEEHLRDCAECAAALARLAEVDAGVGVPDPGPEYWERFNRRVMERLAAERAEGGAAPAKAPRPERAWAGRRLSYFLPIAAAAALLIVVVRQTGMDPFSRTPQPPAPPAAIEEPPRESRSEAPREARPSAPQAARRPAQDAQRAAGMSAAPRESAPLAPAPPAPSDAAPPAPAGPPGMDAGSKGTRETALLYEKGGSRDRLAAAPSAEPAPAAEGMMAQRAASKSVAAAAPEEPPSPCEEARALAGRGRLEEAETAQRACLARKSPPEAQERGMVFLAELLDRQSRFAEADSVLEETRRRFPEGRALGPYLERRPEVRGRRFPAAR